MKRTGALIIAGIILALATVAQARSVTITVVNHAGVSSRLLHRAEHAWRLQSRQVRHYWHTPTIRFGRDGWKLILRPMSTIPYGYAGLHGVTASRTPQAWVGVQRGLLQEVGNHAVPAWEVDSSHELVEMLADPFMRGREVCDPVDFDAYRIDGVAVSAFITPSGRTVASFRRVSKSRRRVEEPHPQPGTRLPRG